MRILTTSFILFLLPLAASADITALVAKAESGDVTAMYELGHAYNRAKGTERDLEKAAYWYEKAAAGNNAKAQYDLGMMYAAGAGVPNDFNRAGELLEAAAKQRHPRAQADYAMLLFGLGPKELKNPIEAYAWLTVIEKYAQGSQFKASLEKKFTAEELEQAKALGAEYLSKYGSK